MEENPTIDANMVKIYTAEAKAMRAYYYTWLGQLWGRVPLLGTGENYITHPVKAKAETYDEMWDFVIKDFKEAAEVLDWKPYNNQYGRVTKGMCLTYMADAYMWKAYRNGTANTASDANIEAAKKCLEEVINSKEYELVPSYTTLWDPIAWQKEAIWEEVADPQSWDYGPNMNNTQFWSQFYAACPSNGGWGTLYLSWEWYTCLYW